MADEETTMTTGGRRDDLTGAGPVISLGARNTAQPARLVSELRDYWGSLRHGRAVPLRMDVQPNGIGRVLDYAFILERIAPGAARFRLAGRHLVDLMGMEIRGMPLCAVFNAGSRGRLSDLLELVFKGPQISDLSLLSPAGYGRPQLHGRMLLLPLKSDLGDVSRALGCLVTAGEIGRGPRRFDLLEEEADPVIPGASVLTSKLTHAELGDAPEPWGALPDALSRGRPLARVDDASPRRDAVTTPELRRAMFKVVSTD